MKKMEEGTYGDGGVVTPLDGWKPPT